MENQNLPKNSNEEVDILRLFEYFKKGVKQIFAGIAGIFVGIFSAFLDLLLLIFKNWPLVLGSTLIFALLGYKVNDSLPPKYSYEMIVKPNYDSSLELYNRVSNLNEYWKSEKDSVKGILGIQEVTIEPIVRIADKVNLYYNVTKDSELAGSPDRYNNDRDTVFYNTLEFKDFTEDLEDIDYPYQKISITSFQLLNTDLVAEEILKDFTEDQGYWNKQRNERINRMQVKRKHLNNAINRADSLLLAFSQPEFHRKDNSTLSLNGSATTTVEKDVFSQITYLSNLIEIIDLELFKSKQIVEVVSNLKQVENNSFRSYLNLVTGALLGFILSVLILLLLLFKKYLKKYEQRKLHH